MQMLNVSPQQNIRTYIVLVLALCLVVFSFYWINSQLESSETTITINNHKILTELAKTPAEHYQGLSDRSNLCENCGLLFVFTDKDIREFVMRKMNFPLDIIWIDDQTVVKIDANLLPEGENPQHIYSSEVPINYVLEVNSGFTDKYDIQIGDHVEFGPEKK